MSLTSANSIILLGVVGLFPVPLQLQGFAADDIFDVDQLKTAETVMGVDGILSGGFVYEEIKQTFAIQADSPSTIIFDQWRQAEIAVSDVYPAFGTIILPGIGVKFTLSNGFMVAASPLPGVKKLVQPRKWTIAWNFVTPAPV